MYFRVAATFVGFAVFATAAPHPSGKGTGRAMPITKHSLLLNTDGTVDFDALDSHVASVGAKIVRAFDNYEKNTGMMHPAAMKKSITEKRSGELDLKTHLTYLWYGTISIGTPPKSFTVDLDTGSSDTFVPSSTCDLTPCEGHTLWDYTSSSTKQFVGLDFEITFQDGSVVSGMQLTDNLTIAGFTADKQTIGAATGYSFHFQKSTFPPDGIMGLAFQSISAYKASPIFETLVGENKVVDSVFSFMLSDDGGELYIGGVNPALRNAEFAYADVTVKGYWQVKLENIRFKGEAFLSDLDAMIDTGSALITGDPSQVADLHKALGGEAIQIKPDEDYYTFPCHKFPIVSLIFGGRSFPIFPTVLNIGRDSPGSPNCVSGIVGVKNTPVWVIGGVFLQCVYTKFDFGRERVGFALLP